MKALVTGGTAGLGRAFCAQLIAAGYDVISLDLKAPERGCGFEHLACDLAQTHSVDFALSQLVKDGPFDLTIFNAGISATGRFEDIGPDAHARVLAVNAEAPMVLCAGLMHNDGMARGAKLAFVSSLSRFTGYPGAASYAAAKDALAVYATSIRKPFQKSHGISVTCAYPGPLQTDHAARHAPQGAKADKRMAPDDAAKLILRDVDARRSTSLPGSGTKLFAALGRLAPKPTTAIMRTLIYEKLDRTVAD